MKKDNFDKAFDSLDADLIKDLPGETADLISHRAARPGYKRAFAIAASFVLVAAFAAAGAALLRSPSATTPDTVSKIGEGSIPDDQSASEESYDESEELSSDPEGSLPEEYGEPTHYEYTDIDNVIYQTGNSADRTQNNVLALNGESSSVWNGVYVTDTLRYVLETNVVKYSVSVNIVPRLSPAQIAQTSERIPFGSFAWNGRTVRFLMKERNKANIILLALESCAEFIRFGYTPEEVYYKFEGNDLYGLERSYFETLLLSSDGNGYVLNESKVVSESARYKRICAEIDESVAAAKEAYDELYPPVTQPMISDDWFKYWEKVLDDKGIAYTVTEMGFFLVTPCDEFKELAQSMSVISGPSGFSFGALFGLTLRNMEQTQ